MVLDSFRRIILVFIILGLSACSIWGGYGANGLSKEEFTAYVEAVFRLQNSLTSRVMMLMEGDDNNQRFAPLLLAEQNMHKACHFLNEYASRENEGLNIGFVLQRHVEKSAVDCEHSADVLGQLLPKYQD